MTPTEALHEIRTRAEAVSGYPVNVIEEPSLRTLATVTMARESVPVHMVRLNPGATRQAEYLVAYQCGFIIRAFALPVEERFDVTVSERGERESASLITQHLRKKGKLPLPQEVLSNLQQQLYSGLIVQLRSMPIGMRVDFELFCDFAALREQQKHSVLRQLQDNALALRPDTAEIAPPLIRNANLTMNAAYADMWAKLFVEPPLTLPYDAAGFRNRADELMSISQSIPNDPRNDIKLVDAWAKRLGIDTWYKWIHKSA